MSQDSKKKIIKQFFFGNAVVRKSHKKLLNIKNAGHQMRSGW